MFLSLAYKQEIRITLFILLLVVLGIGFIVKKLVLFKYLDYINSKLITTFLIVIQLGLSLLLALIIPERYLIDSDFFYDLFQDSGVWVNIVSLLIFLLSIIVIGFIIDLIAKFSNNGNC